MREVLRDEFLQIFPIKKTFSYHIDVLRKFEMSSNQTFHVLNLYDVEKTLIMDNIFCKPICTSLRQIIIYSYINDGIRSYIIY